MSNTLRINMQYSDVTCELCGVKTAFKWGVPTYNGDVVSNDFNHEAWERGGGSINVCERCFNTHANGQVVTYDHLYRQERRTGEDLQDGAGI